MKMEDRWWNFCRGWVLLVEGIAYIVTFGRFQFDWVLVFTIQRLLA